MRECRQPINALKAAQRKLEYFSKKRNGRPVAPAVLYALCCQLDDRSEGGSGAPSPDADMADTREDEVALFDAMVVCDDDAAGGATTGDTKKSRALFFAQGV